MKLTLFIFAFFVLGLGAFLVASGAPSETLANGNDPRIQELLDSLSDADKSRPS